MISQIRHRGLRRLFENNEAGGLPAAYVAKLRRILFALENARESATLDLPGFGLHRLTGDYKGFWSITVSRNWRIVFRFDGEDVTDVDMIDYH